jgi:orotidine 5'-phosphate decarboxylase subfamily 1/orotate phosphoribosyltransferase
MTKEHFILKLHDIGAIKFGDFTLKSGLKSPFYFDLRDMISFPEILDGVADLLAEEVKDIDFDYITGVPYTALPVSTLIADMLNKPLIYARKEEKAYGTKNSIIGKFEKGGKCLVIDDLITTGESILETAEKFKQEGIVVNDIVVIIDRSKNAVQQMKESGYRLKALIDLDEILSVLKNYNRISAGQVQKIKQFTNEIDSEKAKGKNLQNDLTTRLKDKIHSKQSNLILSLDVCTQKEFFEILDQTADQIVMLKTHVDILNDFNPEFILKLNNYSKDYDFMVFEDRKFADIGNTVKHQYLNGIYRIKDWSDFVTVHAISGEGIMQGLFTGVKNRSSFLLAKMSSKGNLMNDTYTRNVFDIGEKYAEVVSGYICHSTNKKELKLLKNKIPNGQLMLTPGVNLVQGNDATGQQYITVEDAIESGADCIIVGRDIIAAENPREKAKEYRERAWKCYNK